MKGRLGRITFAFALSRGLLAFDRTLDTSVRAWFVYGGSPQGARQLLATLAGSMITFTGLVFSSTILVLQLASSQFSPRIMRAFFRDRISQGALGTFIATFAYAVFVLREVREEPGHSFVPGLSTYVAISLVWLSLAMFVAYINHIGERIRAVSIIEIAAKKTSQTLHRLRRRLATHPARVKPELAATAPKRTHRRPALCSSVRRWSNRSRAARRRTASGRPA